MGTAMQVEIDCNQAGLVLRAKPLGQPFAEWTEEQMAAIGHYRRCDECRTMGLVGILKQQPACQEVLLTLARRPGPIYLGDGALTLREQLAIEHVWGRRGQDTSHVGGCDTCFRLSVLWMNAPLHCGYDGENELALQLPLTLEIFIENGWPLDELKQIIEKRVDDLLQAIREAGDRKEEAPWAKTTDPSGYFIPCYADIEVKNLIEALFKALEGAKR